MGNSAPTTVYAYDESGKKLRLSPQDLGARHEERLGSNVQGLGLPPPTQFIVVPQSLMSADEVLLDIVQERRLFSFQLEQAKQALLMAAGRLSEKLGALIWRARVELGKLTLELRESLRKGREIDEGWSSDETEIVDRSLLPGRMVPEVSRYRAPSRGRRGSVG